MENKTFQNYKYILTKIQEQWVHTIDTRIVEKIPKTRPEALKAAGMDKIPVPREAFSKWVKVSQSLQKKTITTNQLSFKNEKRG